MRGDLVVVDGRIFDRDEVVAAGFRWRRDRAYSASTTREARQLLCCLCVYLCAASEFEPHAGRDLARRSRGRAAAARRGAQPKPGCARLGEEREGPVMRQSMSARTSHTKGATA